MSFGTPSADVDTVVAFCRALYGKCRDAGGDYDEISYEVRGLHTVLKHLKYEVEASDSPLSDPHSKWSLQLSPIIGDCDDTLRELDDLVQEHNRISKTSHSTRGDVDRRGSALDTLGLIRVQILSHKSRLTKFLDNIQLPQGGSPKEGLDYQDGALDTILDKVDIIAARIQYENRRSKRNNDDTEVWKQFRNKLLEEGFSGRVLEQHKDVLRAYIREIDQQGLLDEVATQPVAASSSGAERWLDLVKTSKRENQPPSFSSLDLPMENAGTKAITTREENMKFPQSMKLDLRKVEPQPSRPRRTSDQSRRTPAIPRLITSTEGNEKAVQYLNTDNSSDSDSDRKSRRRSNNMQLGEVIKTTELIAYSQALQLHPHSPSSFRSTQSYFENEPPSRALPYQPKKQLEYSTSPLQPGAIPIPQPNPRQSNPNFSTSQRPSTFRLAPDEYGNEIPHDAKWTKINRRLVSPEVLDQDHLRYEARPEFVAVLGVLSRAEIESLAERSRILRDARHRRSLPTQGPPPTQPPRPIPVPSISKSRHRNGRDTPSSSESQSESENSSQEHRRRRKNKGYAGSNIATPVSGYPNPFGQPLPSPVKSPSFKDKDSRREHSNSKYHDRERERDRDRDRDRDREESRHRRSHGHRSSTSNSRGKGDRGDRDREREREKERKYEKSSRWKENLTAAGIGGAAVSLLNVLSEAAEGL